MKLVSEDAKKNHRGRKQIAVFAECEGLCPFLPMHKRLHCLDDVRDALLPKLPEPTVSARELPKV